MSTNFFGKLPEFERGEDSTDYFDFRDNLTLLDASVLFGVGYILGNNIDINLKYNLGVTNLHKEEYTKGNWKKNWATLSVGYTFRD